MRVRGNHVYKNIWEAAVGETLHCLRRMAQSSDTSQEGLACLCSIAEARREYSVYCHWETKIFG